MAVRIRLKRIGAKNSPVFRIVVADSRSPRDGKFLEELGTYHPLQKGNNFNLDLDRAEHWVKNGAQPSETVASFIKKARKSAPAHCCKGLTNTGFRYLWKPSWITSSRAWSTARTRSRSLRLNATE